MVDHRHGRVFAYGVPRKGVTAEAEWVPNRMIKDINNMGYKDVKVQIKSDQEPAIVAVQEYIRLNRSSPTILTNSPVGESESNGRVENAIRRIQDKVRTLKEQVESEAGTSIEDMDGLMSWLVRWAGELVTKSSIGKDGKTAYERIRGQTCRRQIAQVGESVLYIPLGCVCFK